MRRALAVLSFVAAPIVALACGGGEGAPPQAPSAPPGPSASPDAGAPSADAAAGQPTAEVPAGGIDEAAIDKSVSPCDDFYQYACGNWIKNTKIPADEATWYRSFSVIRDRNEEILRTSLEGFAKDRGNGEREPYAKKLGDFYGSCTDEATIEKLGTKPIQPYLAEIDAVKDPASLTKLLGKLEAEGLPMVFELSAAQDFGDATKVIGMLWEGGLGMPEREYYLENTPKMAELRGKYEQHVAAMMKLAGQPEDKAKESAKTVLKIETMLAKAWMPKEQRREPKKIHHRATRSELPNVAPGIAWADWLAGANAKDVEAFNVAQPNFMKAVGSMINGKVSIPDWKTYLTWHLFRETGDELPKAFVDEKFRWKQILVGAKELPPRWKRCVRNIDGAMGEALGQAFVKKTLGARGKETVVGMVKNVEQSMHHNLEKVAWMDEPTRKAAFEKLADVANKIAYPDKWRNYDALAIRPDDYLGNMVRSSAFEYRRQLGKIGKPVDRGEWQMSPPTVNAYYDAQLNEMVFPAGILQPPFYANAAPMPQNYGGIGMVMGHELTHGFDDEGRQFDAKGNLKDWWSKKVNAEFERRAACVKKQYDDYTVLGDVHVNGKLTLGENIADLGGVKLAFESMLAREAEGKGAGAKSSEFTPEQQFFLGFAQGWCGKLRDEALRHLVATNPHSPPNLRVNGPLSNFPEFAKAFACKPGSKMVRKDQCEVW